jgi:chorismate dehydratase
MINDKIKISAVRYANTYPFIYGMSVTGFDRKIALTTDHPYDCASRLIKREADIGLIPVAALPLVGNYNIITDYCLGAYGKVRTVMLLSNCRFKDIRKIFLDYRSRSSVNLVKILAKNFWSATFEWADTSPGFDFLNIAADEAAVLIGDQCFEYEHMYDNRIDLAEEWFNYTGLPFTFACWTANRELDKDFITEFNNALATGVNNIPAVVDKLGQTGTIRGNDLFDYLTRNISFDLNEDKRKAIDLFLRFLKDL